MTAFLGVEHIPFNNRMREARVGLGWTRSRLAQEVGLSPGQIGRYEALKEWPGPESRFKIALALGVPEDDLFPDAFGEQVRAGGARSLTTMVPDEVSLADPALRMLEAPPVPVTSGAMTQVLDDAMEGLTGSQRYVLRRLFGLDGPATMLTELADELYVSPSRVARIRDQALLTLRRSSGLHDYRQWYRSQRLH